MNLNIFLYLCQRNQSAKIVIVSKKKYVFAVFNQHVIGTLNDVLQMIVFGVIFFVASFWEKTSESKSDDEEENAEKIKEDKING